MAQRKDSPNTPTKGGSKAAAQTGGGNSKTAGGGGKGAPGGDAEDPAGNTTVHREKAAPGDRRRGETSHADRA